VASATLVLPFEGHLFLGALNCLHELDLKLECDVAAFRLWRFPGGTPMLVVEKVLIHIPSLSELVRETFIPSKSSTMAPFRLVALLISIETRLVVDSAFLFVA